MPIYLPTAVLGSERSLLTFGLSGEIMGWFYPSPDGPQQIHQCLPCIYLGEPENGALHWTWGDEWQKHQAYDDDSNILVTTLRAPLLGLTVTLTDLVPPDTSALLRHTRVHNESASTLRVGAYLYGDWNLDGRRTANSLIFSRGSGLLLQSHREAAAVIGGDALQEWQCAKTGKEWGHNALDALQRGRLQCQDLEIGDVSWAFGFSARLESGGEVERCAVFALGRSQREALAHWHAVRSTPFAQHAQARRRADAAWLAPGLETLRAATYSAAGHSAAGHSAAGHNNAESAETLPVELLAAYKRSLLCLPLLKGAASVPVAAPEFDPEFLACGGYGYFWPRDGAEYLSGLLDAGYPQLAAPLFDWCARHQDESGLWHQRYFLNGEPGPNWCLPPDMLQIDQVGALLWAFGKFRRANADSPNADSPNAESPDADSPVKDEHRRMVRKAADYLLSRLGESGVHENAFDTWETFVGSFTYSNAAIYAALRVAHELLGGEQYAMGARRVKDGVLRHFTREENGVPYLVRGFKADGTPDTAVDSASLGAIEPFGLLDLHNADDLRLAQGTLQIVGERLETDWEGGRALRRFEGDTYVGGVPACVNTLWMARCCLRVAAHLRETKRAGEAAALTVRARLYLQTVLHRATPTGLLPELMQGPDGQHYWAAPHGWAMASFVSGVLRLARELAAMESPISL